MGSHQQAREFLESGSWVPLDACAQLARDLEVLRTWMEAHAPLDRRITLPIKIALSDIDHLLSLGTHCNVLVPVDRWKTAVRATQLLVEDLTSH